MRAPLGNEDEERRSAHFKERKTNHYKRWNNKDCSYNLELVVVKPGLTRVYEVKVFINDFLLS